MAAPTRWGFLGAGLITNDFVVAMRTLPGLDHKRVAVASRDLLRAQEFSLKHDIERAYGSYKELVEDSDVEVVYISTVNSTHKELCILALNHGKHVICEKPITLNLKEAQEVFALATTKGLFCMEAVWTRFFPLYIQLQKQLKCKDTIDTILGDVKFVQAYFGISAMSVQRVLDPNLGGGALLDVGIYCLTLIDMVYGGEMPESICASGAKTKSGVDKTVCVSMKYSNGRMAQFTASIDVPLPNTGLISGTKGSINICSPFWSSEKIMFSDGSVEDYLLPPSVMPLNFKNSTGMRYEIEGVRECLLAHQAQSLVIPHSTTERILGYMDEIRKQIGVVFPKD
ncbi:predicted protein [Nematostella vectensis]|uniref:Trans-1,2-dihydrobenzene-1,2-diol dehydrogenase n=1 Tax=Nematostella vectensis TaxID=45351 RepID=A7SPL2_NEMVE|nr:trans-1,2-dihydrobenzene-1,2-diol dehydrogenase [Nematostella vectensis]EDO34340.1 predicted protein [Nematostella vectensis]|eukprot:XP_001626440.1 predicted protein [Nematostella vectensis]